MKSKDKKDKKGTYRAIVLAALVFGLGLVGAAAQAAPERGTPPPAGAARANSAAARSADAVPRGVVNLNTATAEQLVALPGVGPAKAAAIIVWRKRHGAFSKVNDLTRVRGFGRKTLARLRPHLATSGPTTYVGPARRGAGAPAGGPARQ